MQVYGLGRLGRLHKALGDPTRLRIINLLAHRGELCVCDVESSLEISQSKASRHLVYLRNAGLLEDRRDATWVYYRVVRGQPLLRSLVRGVKKALTDDETTALEVARSCAAESGASCAPIRLVRKR